jgi:Xaa-Pro dipeptidase
MATEVQADEKGLRESRLERALAEMEAHEIDVLLLGREANARYVSGAQRLWTAGTRPFGPGCVVVRAPVAVYLLSTWDEGIPEDIPHENLFGITWNPGKLLAWLKAIDGVADARRIGTDSLTPRFAKLLPKLFPSAEFVDVEPALEAARRIKTPEEVVAIRTAVSVAETALAAAVAELRPGVSEHLLAAVFMEAMARQGVTTPATQRAVWVASDSFPEARDGSRRLRAEDLVAFDAAVVSCGYSGEVGRTWPVESATADVSTRRLYRRADELLERLLGVCRPGAYCGSLLDAYEVAGHAVPPFPIASGLGLGFDVPVVTASLPKTAAQQRLDAGMMLAITAHVEDEDSRAVFRKEAVLITDDGAEVLTSSPHWEP